MNHRVNDVSFIKADGSLYVEIPTDSVSWSDLLYFSRATNSNFGGWNNKTFWRSRGLDRLHALIGAGSLRRWTQYSMGDNTPPLAREVDFRFERNTRTPVESYSDCSPENAINTALFGRKHLKLANRGVDLLGYEVPLAATSDGQLKIDLLGCSLRPGGGWTLEIVELKNGKNTADSPLLAFLETVCYALQSLRCWKYLRREIAPSLPAQEADRPSAIHLTVLAPAAYWTYWDVPPSELKGLADHFQLILADIEETLKSSHQGTKLIASLEELPASG